ncbi:MAG: hypothetical protein MZV64_43455 [Ignavibacteriales bacterium]|nr:hypothetical protein [Ignavibacteriales bacterium]
MRVGERARLAVGRARCDRPSRRCGPGRRTRRPRSAQHVEGLRARDLVHEVQADEELRLAGRQARGRCGGPRPSASSVDPISIWIVDQPSGLARISASSTTRPPIRCSWMIRSSTGGSQFGVPGALGVDHGDGPGLAHAQAVRARAQHAAGVRQPELPQPALQVLPGGDGPLAVAALRLGLVAAQEDVAAGGGNADALGRQARGGQVGGLRVP